MKKISILIEVVGEVENGQSLKDTAAWLIDDISIPNLKYIIVDDMRLYGKDGVVKIDKDQASREDTLESII